MLESYPDAFVWGDEDDDCDESRSSVYIDEEGYAHEASSYEGYRMYYDEDNSAWIEC